MKLYQLSTLIFVLADLSSCASVGRWPLESCKKQGLTCDVQTSNCLTGWPEIQQFTPSSPEDLKVKVSIRQDEAGQSFPVINAQWKLRDEGSVSHLNGTELQVVVRANNQNICVKYSLYEHLKEERNPSGEQWSFTVDNVVVHPDQTYWVYVFNHPKPKINYTTYNVKEEITVPGCRDPEIKMTQFCIETGSLWQPNITMDWTTENYSSLAVMFNTDVLSEKYRVLLRCHRSKREIYAYKNNQTSLNLTFSMKSWPRICCDFTVEIKPHFPACENDCERREKGLNMCPPTPTPTPCTGLSQAVIFIYVAIVLVVLCVGVYFLYRLCRPDRDKCSEPLPSAASLTKDFLPKQPPKVLVIYSQDHRLYRDIVLKLCAFLQSKCGMEVLVDLLDSTSVGTVGRLRWLEWQRRQLTNPTDKVLVLCSRGVQAKWRAMCGQGPVTLREDVNSPTDDMLIPFLNLLLPDMHHPATLGKYMVAYFEGVSDERDVPSVFDIAVKYKLMKHFEELYFRILDIEKFQPSQVNHIEGIGMDEFFSCPSGKALKDAIELFRAHQLENPDWFESECVDNEEELMAETNLLINRLEVPPVLECVPLIREGSPVYMHNVEINHNNDSLFVRTPELYPEWNMSPVLELEPRIIPLRESVYPLNPLMVPTPGVHTASLYHTSHVIEPVYRVQPMSNKPPWPTEECLNLEAQLTSPTPTENEEGVPSIFLSQSFPGYYQRVAAPHNSLNSSVHLPETRSVLNSRPVEIKDAVVAEHSGKGSSTGSDQGYMSRISSQHTSPLKQDDPLFALARLQEELFQKNHQHTGTV